MPARIARYCVSWHVLEMRAECTARVLWCIQCCSPLVGSARRAANSMSVALPKGIYMLAALVNAK